jgi:hypothetical protein
VTKRLGGASYFVSPCPRRRIIDTNPRFLPVDLARQLLPETFEHALDYLLDHAIDLSTFDARFTNDETGATAYPPAVLLKVVLVAYSQGIRLIGREMFAIGGVKLPSNASKRRSERS